MSEKQQEEKITYMTQTPIPNLVWKLGIPTIISMLVSSFYNMVDTFFVGRISTQATAAVGVVFSLMTMLQAVSFLFGHGSGNYISRKLGEKKYKEANEMASTGFIYAIVAGCLIMIVGLLFLEPLSYFLGATDSILIFVKQYLGVILIGAPFIAGSFVLNNQLRFQGSASIAMVGIVSGAVLNIILDPIFIFYFELGVMGAALATVISQVVGFLLLWAGTRKGSNISIRLKNFSPDKEYMINIIRGGIPSLCRQGLGSVATIVLNQVAGPYGDSAIAAMSIVSRIAMFANSALIGFGQGFQPVCGFNYGAKLYKRVREAFYYCLKYSIIALVLLSLLGYIFAPNLIEFFREDKDVIEIGTIALRFLCITFPLNSYIILCNMMLQSIGRSLKASIVASARQGIFFLPAIIILPLLMGIRGIQISQAVADGFTFLLAVPLGLSVLNEFKQSDT
ncbi:MAG: MATE family efflux transporter [Lachnospiraceae bacterium]